MSIPLDLARVFFVWSKDFSIFPLTIGTHTQIIKVCYTLRKMSTRFTQISVEISQKIPLVEIFWTEFLSFINTKCLPISDIWINGTRFSKSEPIPHCLTYFNWNLSKSSTHFLQCIHPFIHWFIDVKRLEIICCINKRELTNLMIVNRTKSDNYIL